MECKSVAVCCLVKYLREHHPKLRQFHQLRRDPHIEGWLQSLLGFKPATRSLRIRYVKLFFDEIGAWGWPQAPAPGLLSFQDLPPAPFVLPKPLPPDVDQALQQILERADTVNANSLLLMRLTGIRVGELRDLSIHAMEGSEAHGFSLRVPIGKTHAERLIPLSPRAASLVQRIRAARGTRSSKKVPRRFSKYLVVNERGRHLTQQSFSRILREFAAQTPTTENVHPHRLRHSFATEMARAGVPLPALMKLLGHRTPKMTMRYVDVAQTDLRKTYDHALTQIKPIDLIESPALPAPSFSLSTPVPEEIPTLLQALISRIESLRRDATNQEEQKQLDRLVRRLRRYRNDLEKIL